MAVTVFFFNFYYSAESKQEDGKICPVVGKHTTRSSSEIIESKDYGKVEKPFVCESSASSKKAIVSVCTLHITTLFFIY